MPSFPNFLGLTATSYNTNDVVPNHAPAYLCIHFLFAYMLLSPRPLKQMHKIDTNASPRYDLQHHGEEAIRTGKITRPQFEMMQRMESASANSIENFVFFAAAMGFATFSGVQREVINWWAFVYTLVRVGYGGVYTFVGDEWWSKGRGFLWWAGNLCCLRLLTLAAMRLDAGDCRICRS